MQRPWKSVTHWLAHQDLLSLISYITQTISSGEALLTSGLGPPPSIINEGNVSQSYLQANLVWTFSLEVLSSRMTLACVKLT